MRTSIRKRQSKPSRSSEMQKGRRSMRVTTYRAWSRGGPRAMPGEIKYVDCAINAAAVPGNTTLFSAPPVFAEPNIAWAGFTWVNNVGQGAGVGQRIGQQVNIISVKIDMDIVATATTPNHSVRILLVRDMATNGVAPALQDILSAPGLDPYLSAGINNINKGRFFIMYDQYVNISSSTSLQKHVQIYKKGMWPTVYRLNGGTIADFQSGTMFLIAMRGTGFGVGDTVIRNAIARIRFVE